MKIITLPYRSGVVNAVFTICFEVLLSCILLLFSLRVLHDFYESIRLNKGSLLKLKDIIKRRSIMEILFAFLIAMCFIIIELGIKGTSRGSVLLLEVNQTSLLQRNTDSHVFNNYRSILKLYDQNEAVTDHGINCIFTEKNSTPMQGKAEISRVKIVVLPNEISGNKSSSIRLAKIQNRTCGGRTFTYTWKSTSRSHNCTFDDLVDMTYKAEPEVLIRNYELGFFRKVVLPSCLPVDTEMPFFIGSDPYYMASTKNITTEAALLLISNTSMVLTLVRFELQDQALDYGAEVALSFIERNDESIHHSVSQAINNVYEIFSEYSSDSNENYFDYAIIQKGNYSLQPAFIDSGSEQVTTISVLALLLTSLLSIVTIGTAIAILVLTQKINRYHLSERGSIASILNRSFRNEEEINVIHDINIAIRHKPDFDHLAVHNSLIPTGRREGYQIVGANIYGS